MKNVFKILLILSSVIVLTGCWNYREINQDFIATAAAIDKGEDGYLVTVEITTPKKGSEKALENDYIIEQGRTIFEAIRKTILQSGRKLYWGHAKVIIISKEVAEEGILPILDFLARDTEVRNKVWLMISMEENASVLLKGKDEVHDAIGFHIDEVLKNQKDIGMFYAVDLLAFLRDLSTEGIEPTIATSKLIPSGDGSVPRVEGMAIFECDKMIGWLDGIDVKSFLVIIDEFQGGEFATLEIEGLRVTLEIQKIKTKVKPILENEKITMDISITMDAGIVEINGEEDYMSEDKVEQMRKTMEGNIEKDIKKLIKKVQEEYKVDIFGFGNAIYRYEPKVWKEIRDEWHEEFPKVEVQINVDITIKGTGLLQKQIRGAY